MASINDLPEEVLLELFSLVPALELLRHCRPVCSLWRDLIDQVCLWKRKCQQEGLISKDWNHPVADWKAFYLCCSHPKNLIHNACGQDGLNFWITPDIKKDYWTAKDIPGLPVQKCFFSCYGHTLKSQMVNLKAEGYGEEMMDIVRPDIVVKDMFAIRYNIFCTYYCSVLFLDYNFKILHMLRLSEAEYRWINNEWIVVSCTLSNYSPGIRYIYFQHGGMGFKGLFWPYVFKVTSSSITIGPVRFANTQRQMENDLN
ncbi:F-box only protein 6-like [Dromiciops gliroides]|uniref:F-box only protein 6-like n=1 Tax=Dromiciops gliroides TaxID=33562 RepID=UPI001CC4A4B6|nr:F-box only protein 6-like [Dromiciops gliroides]XP_043849676.1 F-box only protein 6-like [Dromiciops gliroides]